MAQNVKHFKIYMYSFRGAPYMSDNKALFVSQYKLSIGLITFINRSGNQNEFIKKFIQCHLVAVTIATRFSTPNCLIARGNRGSLAC